MTVARDILLVINPISGDLDKQELIDFAEKQVVANGGKFYLYKTTGQNDKAELRKLVETTPVGRILVAGGDGTFTMTVEALEGLNPTLALIPMGSANGLAVSLGIPVNATEAVQLALEGTTSAMDAVRIGDDLSLHLSDLGLNALLIKNYEAGDLRGKLGYVKEVVKTLTEYEVFQTRIKTKTETFETDAVIVIIANAQRYGTGVAINPTGDISDGKFEIVVATKIDVIELAKLLTGNTDFDPEIVRIFSTDSVEIELIDKSAHFQIDGEYKGLVHTVKAEIVPSVVRVVLPDPSRPLV